MSKLLDQLNQMTAPLKTDALFIGDGFGGTLEEQYITLEDFTKYFNDLTALTVVAEADILAILSGGTLPRKITVSNLFLGGGKRIMSVLVNDSTALTSGDGKAYFPRIPSYWNGLNITGVAANIIAGTALVTIQIHNLTQTADILSTALTIDANEKDSKDAATPAVIDTNEDDLQTGDRLRIDIDGAGTGTTWLDVQITAQLP